MSLSLEMFDGKRYTDTDFHYSAVVTKPGYIDSPTLHKHVFVGLTQVDK